MYDRSRSSGQKFYHNSVIRYKCKVKDDHTERYGFYLDSTSIFIITEIDTDGIYIRTFNPNIGVWTERTLLSSLFKPKKTQFFAINDSEFVLTDFGENDYAFALINMNERCLTKRDILVDFKPNIIFTNRVKKILYLVNGDTCISISLENVQHNVISLKKGFPKIKQMYEQVQINEFEISIITDKGVLIVNLENLTFIHFKFDFGSYKYSFAQLKKSHVNTLYVVLEDEIDEERKSRIKEKHTTRTNNINVVICIQSIYRNNERICAPIQILDRMTAILRQSQADVVTFSIPLDPKKIKYQSVINDTYEFSDFLPKIRCFTDEIFVHFQSRFYNKKIQIVSSRWKTFVLKLPNREHIVVYVEYKNNVGSSFGDIVEISRFVTVLNLDVKHNDDEIVFHWDCLSGYKCIIIEGKLETSYIFLHQITEPFVEGAIFNICKIMKFYRIQVVTSDDSVLISEEKSSRFVQNPRVSSKKKFLELTDDQLRCLQNYAKENKRPSIREIIDLSYTLNIPRDYIKYWFSQLNQTRKRR